MSRTNTPAGLGSEYHPLESPQLEEPHPFLARARRQEPVFFSPALGSWVVTRHADISAIVADTERFSSAESITVGAATTPKEVIFCIGAPLARLEARLALEALLRSLPGLRLVPGQKPGFLKSVTVRRHESLEVAWDVQAL